MKHSAKAVIIAALTGRAAAGKDFYGRVAHGTIGLGQAQYAPVTCGYACRGSMASWMLTCSSSGNMSMSMDHMMSMTPPSPDCYASNDPFLTSLAWCISTHCPSDLRISQIEDFWEMNVAGRMDNQPRPKYSYQDALMRITTTPTVVHNTSFVLNGTELVSEFFYAMVYGSLDGIERNISVDNQYALVALLTCSLAPIILSLLRFVPLPPSWTSKFYAHVIDPPVFGTRHAVPAFFGLGVVPTRGQALFIFYIWALNIILSAVAYQITWPNLWFIDIPNEMVEWIANRTGMLSFANLTLAVLYSSRNNILLYVTNWSRSTFVLIHRWIAVICILQACLHSALYLQMYDTMGPGMLTEESAYPYWIWGIVGTLALVLILPGSILPIRQKAYEFFLDWHLVWALLAIIGCFLHIYYRYHWQWGYEIWVATAFAVWAADWLLARPLRLARVGLGRRAYVSALDDDYLRVDIPGCHLGAAGGHAYLYFPTMSWRFWENHPFSAVPASSLPATAADAASSPPGSPPSDDLEAAGGSPHAEKPSASPAVRGVGGPEAAGVSFFVRRCSGLTRRLATRAGDPAGIPVLVEATYRAVRSPDPSPSRDAPNVVLLAGGVGITALLPLLDRPLLAPPGATKLYWGVRSRPLVRAVERLVGGGAGSRWGDAEVSVSVGERFNVRDVLEAEILGDAGVRGGTTVVVCGPPAMSDEARLAVADLAKRGAVVRFMEERFSE